MYKSPGRLGGSNHSGLKANEAPVWKLMPAYRILVDLQFIKARGLADAWLIGTRSWRQSGHAGLQTELTSE